MAKTITFKKVYDIDIIYMAKDCPPPRKKKLLSHKDVGKSDCHFSAHGCFMCLENKLDVVCFWNFEIKTLIFAVEILVVFSYNSDVLR